jgi:hypothetical protein
VHVDPPVAHVVTACDGTLTLGELIEFVGADVTHDPAALRASAARSARELVEMGMLEPVSPAWGGEG